MELCLTSGYIAEWLGVVVGVLGVAAGFLGGYVCFANPDECPHIDDERHY